MLVVHSSLTPRMSSMGLGYDDSSLVEYLSNGSLASGDGKEGLKLLIYGRTGWIGGLLGELCKKEGIHFEYGRGRLEDRKVIAEDIRRARPTHVFNAAGVTGRPNVDWCESHKAETIRANVVGTLTLAEVCKEKELLKMNFAAGCIFEYDKELLKVLR